MASQQEDTGKGGGLEGETARVILADIARKACLVESLAAVLPPMWRRAKFKVCGLKNASQYNGIVGVVKGIKPDSGNSRVMMQLLNEERSELSVKRANLELSDGCLNPEKEPILAMSLERLKLSKSEELPSTQEGLESAVRNWVQGLVDITFQVENDMVEKEFDSRELFDEVLGMLQDVEAQCLALHRQGGSTSAATKDPATQAQTNPAAPEETAPATQNSTPETKTESVDLPEGTQAMVAWLGESMAECVHWRRGALSYMLTATLASDKRKLDRQILQGGIQALDRMLETRGKRMGANVADAEGDDNVRAMIQACILSDTHLLAVVYTGEMCYWAYAEEAGRASGETDSEFKNLMRAEGVERLERYLNAVRLMTKDGGGVGAGWDTSRAEELLAALRAEPSPS